MSYYRRMSILVYSFQSRVKEASSRAVYFFARLPFSAITNH